jgi:hypothetical protein
MKRALGVLAALCLAALALAATLSYSSQETANTQPITADEIAKLEPEICEPGSSRFQAITGALPYLVGSLEQIALIEQLKASSRRKVWIIRLPATFITYRTCDAGRTNWVGEGDHIDIGQHYRLSLALGEGEVLPSRATKSALETAIRVDIDLHNLVRDPGFFRRTYAKSSIVIGRVGVNGPPRCREEPSDIAGLVTFKRIDPDVRSPSDCEGGRTKVFAKKIDDLVYDFIAICAVNCLVESDYRGWRVQYSYHYAHLVAWQQLHERLREFLDQHTVYLDQDGTGP